MEEIPYKNDYVRYALWSAGFNPTDEIVNQIYATGHPVAAVDGLIAAMRAYPPTNTALEFMESMQQIVHGAGTSAEHIGEMSEQIRKMAE